MRPPVFIFLFVSVSGLFTAQAQKNDAPLAKNAPEDKVTHVYSREQRRIDSLMAPYLQKAQTTYKGAKDRFLKGLKPGESFFVVTRLFDKDGKFEQVFIRVKSFSGDTISGMIANELTVVKEYSSRQLITFNEKNVMDWLIAKPGGSEEGNFIGKFMDTQH